MKNHYDITDPPMKAIGSEYFPLLTDGHDYLCPTCGGYGVALDKGPCKFCDGLQTISLSDPRVVKVQTQ
jgi:DnaJ-class molecular chaperone